jgi:putative SOS response-associated peptidase YedK
MCGRIANMATPEDLARAFEWVKRAEILEYIDRVRYNVAPQTLIPAIRASEGDAEWALFKWGLIPSWAKDPTIGNRMINARAETVDEKPAFKAAFRSRRCLIPISGFFEWKRRDGSRQPYFIRTSDEDIFTLAGLWERWRSPEGEEVETCTVLTTEPNDLVATLHDRMPVIVSPEERELWLFEKDTEVVRHVLRSYDPDRMQMHPVSRYVNNVRNDGPECVTPVPAEGDGATGQLPLL